MLRVVLLAFVILTVSGHAAEDATPRFSLDLLRAQAQKVDHLRIPFRQIKDLEMFNEPVVIPGVMEISRPLACVRWEFQGRSVLVLRNGRLHRWGADGTKEHVHAGPAAVAMAGQMSAMLSGDWRELETLFNVRPDPSGAPKVVLTPRDEEMARHVSQIRLVFGDDLSAPRELSIEAPSGDTTRYEFDAPERPADLAAARFAGP